MAQVSLKCEKRTVVGKEDVKRLRKSGYIPAVIYGRHSTSLSIQVSNTEFSKMAHGEHGSSLESILISLSIAGDKSKKRMTLIKDLQRHPITNKIIHIDFHEVSLTEKIHAHIPIVSFGSSKGEKQGGILDHTLREIEVVCLPTDLPEEIKLDISDLNLHDSIHVRDLDLGDKVEITNDKGLSILSIIVPRIVEEVIKEEEEKGLEEPEVIGQKAEDEKEEEAK